MEILNNNVAKYHFSKKSGLLIASLLLSSQSYAEIRDITFQNLSVDTTTQGTELYNNGRMQKPVVVKYVAYLADDLANRAPVELTEEEAEYYLKFSEYGETQPQPIEYLNPQIEISTSVNQNYDMNLDTAPQAQATRSRRSLSEQESYKATFYLSYKGANAYDTVNQLEICVYGNPERRDDYNRPVSGYPNNDCANNPSSKRLINVISGAYSYVGENINQLNAINLTTEKLELCTNQDNCDRFRVQDTSARDINSAVMYQYKFTPTRSNHTLRPVDGNLIGQLAAGCVIDSHSTEGDVGVDGICSMDSRWDFYYTSFAFGNNKIDYEGYATYRENSFGYGGYWGSSIYNFYSDQNKYGAFTISGTLMDLATGSDDVHTDEYAFIRRIKYSGHWAGSTGGEKVVINKELEDNYGNRFLLTGELVPDPGYGKLAGESDQNVFVRLDKTTLNITSIYK
ncbi:hypothetical protein AB4487_04490 [Vibrio splendidus]|uniref:hypothetical protein n=1 Tax=Vibrio TaxID=662 RepID=UPI000C82F884|nr:MULTISPECIES: hypothetical protein [Vibrio]PMM40277.1 hypothetical protein BCT58_20730 [Vibrio lentus]PMO94635.1 hypothetical protein BCS97_16850 [Vibrio splendidus]PMP23684.1 hypothetical protein BCS89_15650 [Vibrio splendidus]PMP35525.1 hypothetical protein BCS88_08740 [Vibrio splendidus]PMP40406.1 hypothetical protein BCS87_08535 [Vibrio splendidus]